MKCPHCNQNIDVRFTKAPPDLQTPNGNPQSTDSADLGELLGAIDDESLTGQAVDFVRDMRERFAKYKDKTRCSEKQLNWLKKLAHPDEEEF